MDNYDGPDVSIPIIVGIVLGVGLSLAFLIWQGIRLKIIPTPRGDHSGLV